MYKNAPPLPLNVVYITMSAILCACSYAWVKTGRKKSCCNVESVYSAGGEMGCDGLSGASFLHQAVKCLLVFK